MSDEVLDAMRDRIRARMRAERLRELEAAANSFHFAKYTGEGIAAAQKRLLDAAWSYGDTPNALLPREQGNVKTQERAAMDADSSTD